MADEVSQPYKKDAFDIMRERDVPSIASKCAKEKKVLPSLQKIEKYRCQF
jgi:hypothetical protein